MSLRVAGPLFGSQRGQTGGYCVVDRAVALTLTNAALMKLHRVFVTSYAIGWLIKLEIAAIGVGLFLR